ncbi:TMEM143 family protein [Bradyrhizobium erythrophlei]|uniref:TMEM143 family protein n=1 Tax=Bradyrhizobium erythrophlei TaxID=1437360 RepID=UPI001FD8BE85|nr:TMEM143 family protein [Bradyrhizobium erythrophlei]
MNRAQGEAAAPEQPDRVIPRRKSDIIERLVAEGGLDETGQARLRQLARMLGAIFHYQYFEELDRLREAYFHFDPEVDPRACGEKKDLEAAYRGLSEEFVRILADANFVEITHDEITRAFAERALVRVKIKAPVEDYRDVRMFRRGHHTETIDIPVWFGLRHRPLEVVVYDDVVLMVATWPDGIKPAKARKAFARARRGARKIRCGAVLFKYFRHIARADLEALFPNVRVVMSLSDHFTLGVPAIVGGVPILIKLASTMTVLFVVAGFYLGLTGTIGDSDTERALAALSGLFALGAFLLRQWGNFHRQSLIHQKQLTDNIYYRNVNNNSGIFNYLIGEAEEQDWKEALLAYYGLLTAAQPLTREALGAGIEELLARAFGVSADFKIDDALARLKRLDLLAESDGRFSVLPLPAALAQLDKEWAQLCRAGAEAP